MHENSCRLCGYNSSDLVDIYGDQGVTGEYARKICRYLYLLVTPEDDLSKFICWMCSQQLDSFHRFHEKINEIQQRLLGDDQYLQYVIQINHSFEDDMIIEHTVKNDVPAEAAEDAQENAEEADSEIQQTQLHEETEDDSAIQLIPCSAADDSFIVVKSESSLEQGQRDGESAEANKSDVQIFEICTNTRKTRSGRKTATYSDQTSGGEEEEIHLKQMKTAGGRVTRRSVISNNEEAVLSDANDASASGVRTSPRRTKTKNKNQSATKEEIEADHDEGDSGDEFPARDSDNEEWPAAETMEKFPSTIIKDGLLTVKGKRLTKMLNRFFNLQCDLCQDKQERFKTLPELFDHHQTKHNQEGYVLCCQSKFSRYPTIIMHMARHIQPEAFKCDICGYVVTRPRFLAAHRQTHLPEDQKPYACRHCPKRFCWKRALQIHLNQHKAPEDRTVYVCPLCSKSYDTPGGLSAHKKNVHTTPGPSKASHVCEICAKTFSTSSGLKEHTTTIHVQRDKGQLQCPQCAKWLMNRRCLKVHMQLHSEVELSCDQCVYKCKKPGLLKRHKIMHHQEERPFVCNQCEASYKHKRALTTHVKLKHSEKQSTNYQCNFCDRQFASSTNFYTHRKNSHPEELAALKEKIEQDKKLQRIRAGIEPDEIPVVHESAITTNPDGSQVITLSESLGTMIVLNVTDDTVVGALESNG